MAFEILYRDSDLVAVNKPADMLVHRSHLSRERYVVLQGLRDQLGQRLYPIHRLDRATSGVLVFALDSDAAAILSRALSSDAARKVYLAIVRGWPNPESGRIDRPVRDDDRESYREAVTDYRCLETTELPIPNRRYPQSRYALVALSPKTGRRHQLRIHMERVAHPIVGDTTHGDNDHNRIFRDELGLKRLMLHAWRLTLPHPRIPGRELTISAPPGDRFAAALDRLGWSLDRHRPETDMTTESPTMRYRDAEVR